MRCRADLLIAKGASEAFGPLAPYRARPRNRPRSYSIDFPGDLTPDGPLSPCVTADIERGWRLAKLRWRYRFARGRFEASSSTPNSLRLTDAPTAVESASQTR